MASKIQLKKSAVVTAGIPKAPVPEDLDYGELAINYAGGRIYYKKSDNTIDFFNSTQASTETLETVTGRGATTSTECSFLSGISTNIVKQTQGNILGNTSTTTLNFNLYGNFYILLSLNTTLVFSNLADNIGSSGYIFLKQDSTGGKTFVFPIEAKTPGGRTFTQNTAANSLSMITFYVVDTNTVVVNYIADFK